MNAVLEEAFSRLGFSIEIQNLPSERSLKHANNGIADGNFVRTSYIAAAYPNLRMVPEKLAVNYIVAFSKQELEIDGWKSLLPHSTVYINGWKNCEKELKTAKKKTVVKSDTHLFRFLEKNRADLGIYGRSTGMAILKEMGITDIKPLTPPIVVSDLFLYLNKKHELLIPKVTQTLQQMKANGTYMEIIKRFNAEDDI